MGWQFEIHSADAVGYHFLLRMSNGAVVLTSTRFDTVAECVGAIHAVKGTIGYRQARVRMRGIDDAMHVAVVAAKNEILASSGFFRSRADRSAAIVGIRTLGPTAPIVDRRESDAGSSSDGAVLSVATRIAETVGRFARRSFDSLLAAGSARERDQRGRFVSVSARIDAEKIDPHRPADLAVTDPVIQVAGERRGR